MFSSNLDAFWAILRNISTSRCVWPKFWANFPKPKVHIFAYWVDWEWMKHDEDFLYSSDWWNCGNWGSWPEVGRTGGSIVVTLGFGTQKQQGELFNWNTSWFSSPCWAAVWAMLREAWSHKWIENVTVIPSDDVSQTQYNGWTWISAMF